MAEKPDWITCGVLALTLFGLGQLWAGNERAHAAPAVWRDHATGFAIGGYDPVAYHTQKRPVQGRDGFQHTWAGAAWRFISPGNRDAFAKHPEIYAPRFAGYDAFALSKGLTVQGQPLIWALYRGQVFLFQSEANRRAWTANPGNITDLAATHWERLGENLSGTSRH